MFCRLRDLLVVCMFRYWCLFGLGVYCFVVFVAFVLLRVIWFWWGFGLVCVVCLWLDCIYFVGLGLDWLFG